MRKYKRLKARLEELEAKLDTQLTEQFEEYVNWGHPFGFLLGEANMHRLTLRGELDAIKDHLGVKTDVIQKSGPKMTVKKNKGEK